MEEQETGKEIKVLSPDVANLIAAGEVVERPASVVKELLENSIDAGATSVTVEIRKGGIEYLRITDNGKGIPEDQLETAFLRHATSKLQVAENLEEIATLGFRGEALAAIAAVSKIKVTSCVPQQTFASFIQMEGGEVLEQESTGAAVGTTIIVEDLFFNTPARKKFLKTERGEGTAIASLVHVVALSHPEISVKFIRDGKTELTTGGDGLLKTAIFHVLGKDVALGLRPMSFTNLSTHLEGFVSLPSCCRPSRTCQHFYVNGRYIKSPLLCSALEEAYENLKMVGKFPAAVLHLTVDYRDVDVNVHPAKTQVKFAREQEIFKIMYHGVYKALEEFRDIQRGVMVDDSTKSVFMEGGSIPIGTTPPVKVKTVTFSDDNSLSGENWANHGIWEEKDKSGEGTRGKGDHPQEQIRYTQLAVYRPHYYNPTQSPVVSSTMLPPSSTQNQESDFVSFDEAQTPSKEKPSWDLLEDDEDTPWEEYEQGNQQGNQQENQEKSDISPKFMENSGNDSTSSSGEEKKVLSKGKREKWANKSESDREREIEAKWEREWEREKGRANQQNNQQDNQEDNQQGNQQNNQEDNQQNNQEDNTEEGSRTDRGETNFSDRKGEEEQTATGAITLAMEQIPSSLSQPPLWEELPESSENLPQIRQRIDLKVEPWQWEAQKKEQEERERQATLEEMAELDQLILDETEIFGNWRVVGEAFRTYIVIEVGDDLFFVDKHATHERVNFNRLKEQNYRPMSQPMLEPVLIHLSPEEMACMQEERHILEEFSFHWEEVGPWDIAVDSAPYDLPMEEVGQTLLELVEKLTNGELLNPDATRDHLLHTIACKSAIKAGYITQEEELKAVAEVAMREEVRHCPHGRPILAALSKKDLEKKFKRI